MSRYSHYAYFLQEDSSCFGLKVSTQFRPKNQQYIQRFLELYQLFMNNFLCQTVSKSSFHILAKLLITWLTQFCVITINFDQ